MWMTRTCKVRGVKVIAVSVVLTQTSLGKSPNMAVALQISVSAPEAYSIQHIDNSDWIPENEVQFLK